MSLRLGVPVLLLAAHVAAAMLPALGPPSAHFRLSRRDFSALLAQLGHLQLHLRNGSHLDNDLVQYLLQQTHCATSLSTVEGAVPAAEQARHHFYIYQQLSPRDYKRAVQHNRDGYLIYALLEPPPQQNLLSFARLLWQRYELHRIYYVLPTRILFYNPFALTATQQRGAFVTLSGNSQMADIFQNLNGYAIRIYIFDSVYSYVFGDPVAQRIDRATGADSKVAQLVSEKMNFSMEYLWPDDTFYGARLKNGTFDGALGRILANETDIIFTGYFIKDYFTQDIEFSVALYMDKLCCYVKKAMRIPQSILPLFAVRIDVWLGFFLVGFVGVLVWLGIRALNTHYSIRQLPAAARSHTAEQWSVQSARIFVDTWLVWVRVSIGRFPPYNSERVFVVSLCLVSVIFGALFESSLATVYIHPMYYKDINTLQELAAANLPMYIKHAAFQDDLFNEHHSEVYRFLHSKLLLVVEGEDRLIKMASTIGGFSAVSRAASLEIEDIRYVVTQKIHKIPECPKDYHIAYVFRKHSPYLRAMNFWLLRILSAGLVEKFIDEMKHQAKSTIHKHPEYSQAQGYRWKRLKFNDVQLAFYALALGCLLAFIVLLLEAVARNCQCRFSWRGKSRHD